MRVSECIRVQLLINNFFLVPNGNLLRSPTLSSHVPLWDVEWRLHQYFSLAGHKINFGVLSSIVFSKIIMRRCLRAELNEGS